nr:NnrS family protein [Isorropodon fossajaponicum symbiont]
MTIAHSLFYLGLLGIVEQGVTWGLYLGFYLVLSLILMMIRRLIPFFIERGLGLDHELKNSKFLDLSSLILLVIFIPIEVFFNTPISTVLALALLLIHSIRLMCWYHHAKILDKISIVGALCGLRVLDLRVCLIL